ncbi:Uncharacterised protein [uncultured archaeon]|nr:Uncharacterised protein [uncultured archaeon]
MVLESLIGEKNIRRHPIFVFFLAIIITIGAIYFAGVLFPAHASILSVAFVTIGLVPLVFNVLADEEAEEIVAHRKFGNFFARHFNVIMLYVWIFVGIIVAFALAYAFVPTELKPIIFDEQIKAFCGISGECNGLTPFSIAGRASAMATGACLSATSNLSSCALFIFQNNAGVLIFTIILSLLYGVGAIFIIAWNASILGIFFGETFLSGAHVKWAGMFQSMLVGHGPPELLGYVFGALAGAILSAMVAKRDFLTHGARVLIKDVFFLTGLAIFSVAYGAVMESVGILGNSNSMMAYLYYGLGFIYLLVIILAVLIYGRARPANHCG